MDRACHRLLGQLLAEFALVFPLAMTVLFGTISLGLYVFYSQEVTNAAREAARYAAIHSSTAQCPTVSWRDPQLPLNSYYRCDSPDDSANTWPAMTAFARSKVWGINPASVMVNACWSGYVGQGGSGPTYDQTAGTGTYRQCMIATIDPVASAGTLPCQSALTRSGDDTASD